MHGSMAWICMRNGSCTRWLHTVCHYTHRAVLQKCFVEILDFWERWSVCCACASAVFRQAENATTIHNRYTMYIGRTKALTHTHICCHCFHFLHEVFFLLCAHMHFFPCLPEPPSRVADTFQQFHFLAVLLWTVVDRTRTNKRNGLSIKVEN